MRYSLDDSLIGIWRIYILLFNGNITGIIYTPRSITYSKSGIVEPTYNKFVEKMNFYLGVFS